MCLSDVTPLANRAVYALTSGVCSLVKIANNGDERTLMYFTPKWLISIVPTLLNEQLTGDQFVDVHTKTPCVLYQVSSSQFDQLIAQKPLFAVSVMKVLALNLSRAHANNFDIHDLPTFLRVCKVLLELDHGAGIPPFFTAEEFGGFISAHPVTVAKIIAELKRQKTVERRDKQLFITDRKKLIHILKNRIVYNYK